MSVVVSVRIRKEVKDALDAAGIDIAAEVRGFLEDLAWKSQARKELEELTKLLRSQVKLSPRGFAEKSVREDRDEGH